MNKYYIVTFQNTHEAMKSEREALKNKIKVVVVPTPTYITKSCGISLKVDEESVKSIVELINSENIKVKEIFVINGTSTRVMSI
ncbi:MAG: DUF3343 domain-containing protein [Clostridium sp.]|uniref:DUF3343 domain-containing protein n=1 Tax=Clostridium sp. TaxID=1506 RepID=UPI003D6C73F4